jgi:hypothetical protein
VLRRCASALPEVAHVTHLIASIASEVDASQSFIMVALEFTAGHRWAKLLGFHAETPLRAWLPEG